MYMNLKRNKHKRISFNTTTMTSLGFIAFHKILSSPLNLAPPPNLIFCSGTPPTPNYFGLKSLGPPLKLWGVATMNRHLTFRSSHRRCSVRKVVLRNFAKFTRKDLCQSLFFNKAKRLWHSCFPVNFTKFLRTSILQNTSGRLLLNFAVNNSCGGKSNALERSFKGAGKTSPLSRLFRNFL